MDEYTKARKLEARFQSRVYVNGGLVSGIRPGRPEDCTAVVTVL